MGDPAPQFESFLRRALRDPEVAEAYRRAKRRHTLRVLVAKVFRR